MSATSLSKRELAALLDAGDRPGHWGLFMEKSTEKLAARGLFERAQHPSYGQKWRLTAAGLAEYERQTSWRAAITAALKE